VVYEIDGGGHTWPGREFGPELKVLGNSTHDISANDLIWEFFAKHPLKGKATIFFDTPRLSKSVRFIFFGALQSKQPRPKRNLTPVFRSLILSGGIGKQHRVPQIPDAYENTPSPSCLRSVHAIRARRAKHVIYLPRPIEHKRLSSQWTV